MSEETTKPPDPGAGQAGTGTPQQLVAREDLSLAQKIEILQQWELDLRERMVADDENMPSAEPDSITLEDVHKALDALGAAPAGHPVPTTHG